MATFSHPPGSCGSAFCGTLAASHLSSGAGALTWRLLQNSQGEDMEPLLDVVDHHGGGAANWSFQGSSPQNFWGPSP